MKAVGILVLAGAKLDKSEDCGAAETTRRIDEGNIMPRFRRGEEV